LKAGDKVICINIQVIDDPIKEDLGEIELKLNEIYTVSDVGRDDGDGFDIIYLVEKNDWYFRFRFVTLKENRKLKIKNIEKLQL
jgi:hypothetical protein